MSFPMGLFEVKRKMIRPGFIEFLLSDDYKLAVTGYHAFSTDSDQAKIARDIVVGDKIRVDKSAFGADGSLYKRK